MNRRRLLWLVLALPALSGCAGAPGLAFTDPVTHAIARGEVARNTNLSLIPKPFGPGATEAEVVRQLTAAKYTLDPERKVSLSQQTRAPDGSQVFEKWIAVFPCSYRYVVVVTFDAGHRLVEAWGSREQTACT